MSMTDQEIIDAYFDIASHGDSVISEAIVCDNIKIRFNYVKKQKLQNYKNIVKFLICEIQ